ncbi:MAG: hypothetical protein J6C89_04510 [Clostridia bacterium]|nr:hypothetical protein [Clostridia bacterium]
MKKRFLALLLALSVALLCACSEEEIIKEAYQDVKIYEIKETPIFSASDEEYSASVKYYSYDTAPTGYSMASLSDQKTEISGICAKTIAEMLSAMEVSSKRSKSLSLRSLEKAAEKGDIPIGTKWLEVGNDIYRIEPDGRIAIVKKPLGQGKYLDSDVSFLKVLDTSLNYYPQNTYIGDISGSKLTLDFICEKENDIEIDILNIKAPLADSSAKRSFHFEISLLSKEDRSVTVYYGRINSGCIICTPNELDVELKAGEKQTITLEFTEDTSYSVYIDIGDNYIKIQK